MTAIETCKQRKLAKQEIKHQKKLDKLEYTKARYKVGKTSKISTVLTFLVLAVYVVTIFFGIYLMNRYGDTGQIPALFASVTVPAGTTIFALIQKNTKENIAGGITFETNVSNKNNAG